MANIACMSGPGIFEVQRHIPRWRGEMKDERCGDSLYSWVMVELDHVFTRVGAKIQLASYQGRYSLTFWPEQICIVIPIMINARANNIYSTGLQ